MSAAAEIQAFCEGQGWSYCFVGGIALQPWAEPRETVGVDLTLITGFGDESGFTDPLLAAFAPRIPDAAQFARQRRVLLLRSAAGVGIDIAFGALPFEEEMVQRSSLFTFPPDIDLRTLSGRGLDRIEGVRRSQSGLD